MFGMTSRTKTPTNLKASWQADIGDHVIAQTWSPDGKRLAALAIGGSATLFDAATGAVVHRLAGHAFGASALSWNTQGDLLATAGQDGTIRLWNTATGQMLRELEGGAPWVERIAWSPSGTLLASSAGRCVRLWNTAGQLVRNWTDFPSTVADLRWKPKGLELAVAAYGQLTFWNPEAASPLREFNWKGSMLTIAWSPDGRYLATGDQDSTVHFWIVASGEDLMMSGYETKVRELSWDCTSRYLATGGGAAPCVWDVSGDGPAGTRPAQLKAHNDRVTALAYQHAGPLLASAGADGLIAIWRPDIDERPIARAKTSQGWTQIAWSPEDRRIAVGGEAGRVAVYAA